MIYSPTFIFLCIFFITISAKNECVPPKDTVGMIFDEDSVGTNVDCILFPVAKCGCDKGTKYFYKPYLLKDTNNKLDYFYWKRK